MRNKPRSVIAIILCLVMATLFTVGAFASSEPRIVKAAKGSYAPEYIEKAEAFLAKVGELADTSGIMEKVRIYEEATDPSLYFDDESYPGITEALAALEAIRIARDGTIAFMVAVDELVSERDVTATVAENYTVLKEMLDEAEALYVYVDAGYNGASGAISAYSAIRRELQNAEKHTEGVLDIIELIDSKKDYRSKKNLIANLESSIASEDFIPELDSAKEAVAALERLKAYFSECEGLAQEYIIAVDAIGSAESRFDAIIAAMLMRNDVDSTVNGVAVADGKLEVIRLEYNAYVELINGALLGMPKK